MMLVGRGIAGIGAAGQITVSSESILQQELELDDR